MIEGIEGIELTNLERVLNEYCMDFKARYTESLENSGRKATGNLINSVDLKVSSMGTDITVTLNVADYYRWVENGRPIGKMPPREKILEWITVKNIQPYPMENGKLPTENQLAFLIARKISGKYPDRDGKLPTKGYEGTHDLQNTSETMEQLYIQRFENAIQQDFNIYEERILDSIVKNLL